MSRKQKSNSAHEARCVYRSNRKGDQEGRCGLDYEYAHVSYFIPYHLISKINSYWRKRCVDVCVCAWCVAHCYRQRQSHTHLRRLVPKKTEPSSQWRMHTSGMLFTTPGGLSHCRENGFSSQAWYNAKIAWRGTGARDPEPPQNWESCCSKRPHILLHMGSNPPIWHEQAKSLQTISEQVAPTEADLMGEKT